MQEFWWRKKKLLEKLKFNFIEKKKESENYSRKNGDKEIYIYIKEILYRDVRIDNNSEQSDKDLVKISCRRIQGI